MAEEEAQAFDACIVPEKELGYPLLVVPHELFKKICVIPGGGGCGSVTGALPSLKVTVYMVPGVLDSVPVIGKVNALLKQTEVFPGLFNPTAGLVPTKT